MYFEVYPCEMVLLYSTYLIAPYYRLSTTQHTVAYRGCSVWNTLAQDIPNSASLSIFKRKLKNFFFNRCFATIEEFFFPSVGIGIVYFPKANLQC